MLNSFSEVVQFAAKASHNSKMSDPEYAKELCLQATAFLKHAEVTQEGMWMAEAIDCYEVAMESDPDLLEPYLALAYLWMVHGQPQLAKPFLHKALELSPFDTQLQGLWRELNQQMQE